VIARIRPALSFGLIILILAGVVSWPISVNAATAKPKHYLDIGVNPVNPNKPIPWQNGYCVVIIATDSPMVEVESGTGTPGLGYLRAGQEVVVDENGTAVWIKRCGNGIIQPIGWKPVGRKVCGPPETTPPPSPKQEILPPPAPPASPEPEPNPEPKPTLTPVKITEPASVIPPPSEPTCGKVCKTTIILGGLAAILVIRNNWPDDDDHKKHGCRFGRGIDGHCLPEPEQCNNDPNCMCPPQYPNCGLVQQDGPAPSGVQLMFDVPLGRK